jgi:predicted DNA-binding protein (MmcQ/YjbR family)
MDDAALLSYCLAKPGARQEEPWEGDVVAVVRKLPKSKRPTL